MVALAAIGALGLIALLGGMWWLRRRFAGYEHLPHHFDLRGRADAFGPPWVILRFVPIILITAHTAVFILMLASYDPQEASAALVGAAVVALSMVGSLGLISSLMLRWARSCSDKRGL